LSELGLRNVDLRLTVKKVYIDTTIDLLAVSSGIEDVTDSFSLGEGVVSNLALLSVARVGKGNEELATRERVEAFVNITLHLLLVPNLTLFSLSIDLGNHLIEIGVCVHGLPERFTVFGITASGVVLLGTIVGERNTTRGQSEGLGLLKSGLVATVVAKEARVVVVVNEDTKSINIVEVALFLVVSTLDVVHIFAASEYVTDGVVHRVVEKSSEGVLIWSDVGRVSVEALAHLEYASGLTVFGPEVGGDLGDGVDTNTIETVGLNNTLDPVLEVLANVAIALIKIRESS